MNHVSSKFFYSICIVKWVNKRRLTRICVASNWHSGYMYVCVCVLACFCAMHVLENIKFVTLFPFGIVISLFVGCMNVYFSQLDASDRASKAIIICQKRHSVHQQWWKTSANITFWVVIWNKRNCSARQSANQPVTINNINRIFVGLLLLQKSKIQSLVWCVCAWLRNGNTLSHGLLWIL